MIKVPGLSSSTPKPPGLPKVDANGNPSKAKPSSSAGPKKGGAINIIEPKAKKAGRMTINIKVDKIVQGPGAEPITSTRRYKGPK